MSAKQSFRIEGMKDLDRALAELADEYSPAKAKGILTRSLKKGGQKIADAEKAYAPVGETGQLAASPTVGSRLTRRQRKQNKKESMVEVYVGPTPHPKSVQTEFGNAHQAPQPHLRPAFDGQVQNVLKGFISDAKADLERTRKRLVRKAEREAAKLKAGQ